MHSSTHCTAPLIALFRSLHSSAHTALDCSAHWADCTALPIARLRSLHLRSLHCSAHCTAPLALQSIAPLIGLISHAQLYPLHDLLPDRRLRSWLQSLHCCLFCPVYAEPQVAHSLHSSARLIHSHAKFVAPLTCQAGSLARLDSLTSHMTGLRTGLRLRSLAARGSSQILGVRQF